MYFHSCRDETKNDIKLKLYKRKYANLLFLSTVLYARFNFLPRLVFRLEYCLSVHWFPGSHPSTAFALELYPAKMKIADNSAMWYFFIL